MANEKTLGVGPCPVCGKDCAIKETKKGKSYVTCGECGSQTFARGVVADRLLRGRITASAKPEQRAEPMEHSAAVEQAEKPTPAAAPAVTVTRHTSEGETSTEETTIFDLLGKLVK